MNHSEADGRPLLFALLAVLFIGLLAWGPGIEPAVHAGYLNQTIPTPTPQGQQPTPPSNPVRTPRPTEPQPGPTDTPAAAPVPTSTPDESLAAPSAAPPSVSATEPVTTTAPATGPATETATATVVSSATAQAQSETPGSAPALQASETPVSPASTTTEAVPATSTIGATSPPAGAEATPIAKQDPEAGSRLGGFASLSCLWLAGGLLLIGAGIVVLLSRRRAG